MANTYTVRMIFYIHKGEKMLLNEEPPDQHNIIIKHT